MKVGFELEAVQVTPMFSQLYHEYGSQTGRMTGMGTCCRSRNQCEGLTAFLQL
jgi:hypothetical protein